MTQKGLFMNDRQNTLKTIIPSLIPSTTSTPSEFSTIRQGTGTNTLTKINTLKNKPIIDDVTGTATIEKGNLTVALPNFLELTGFKTTTHQLLDALIATLTDAGAKEPEIAIPLEDYMALRGIKDKKTARTQVKNDLETLYNASISFTEKVKGKPKDFFDMRIIDSKGITKGIITASFSNKFFNVLKGYPIMSYPKTLWGYNNNNNPHSYYFLRRISEHKNMNLGKKNEDIIAVKTLLTASPELPSYEEVKATDRAFNRRIIDPFERDMDAIADTLKWEYCKRNGIPLTDKELNSLNYEMFSKLLVKCSWNNYPDKTARLEKIEASKKKATTRKKKNS